jgi:hypothetical protein
MKAFVDHNKVIVVNTFIMLKIEKMLKSIEVLTVIHFLHP